MENGCRQKVAAVIVKLVVSNKLYEQEFSSLTRAGGRGTSGEFMHEGTKVVLINNNDRRVVRGLWLD